MAHPASHAHTDAPTHAEPHSHRHDHEQDHSHGHRHGSDGVAEGAMARVLDLDAELFGGYLTAVTGRLAGLAGGGVTHIVDLGAGTGTGTFALLERFPGARVTAVDSSPAMLAGLERTAQAKGLGSRVSTLEADAGSGLPGITGADLVWASASLHHLDDPAAALDGIRAALRPGGLLAVAEMDGMPRFLPDAVVPDRPGLEERCRHALSALHADQVPHLGADWGALLTAAGLTVEAEHTEDLELRAPLPPAAGEYAHLVLGRVRDALDGRLDPADRSALDAVLNGGALDVRHRDDLTVRSTRWTWTARRPTDRP
ncbi:methyltransferase [Kitasatospora paranensis]|uniref:Methyltransferase n=1 Tax=Kitasatospora paranensis TaxID=258053 RepID=A0ABW2FZK7_9ACTN